MQTSQLPPSRPASRRERPRLPLGDLLDALAGVRATRLELVCWDLNVEEELARPAWDVALRTKLLEPAGEDPLTGKAMYALSDLGRRAVSQLRPRRRRA
jgi:hypothetical protein